MMICTIGLHFVVNRQFNYKLLKNKKLHKIIKKMGNKLEFLVNTSYNSKQRLCLNFNTRWGHIYYGNF